MVGALLPVLKPSLIQELGVLVNSLTNKFSMDGVIGGAQIGYNWQNSRWVFGVETDIQGSRQKRQWIVFSALGVTGQYNFGRAERSLHARPSGYRPSVRRPEPTFRRPEIQCSRVSGNW